MIADQLRDFIEVAEKNRKYTKNTALGKRTALKLFEAEFNDQEKESLSTVKENFDKIFQAVHNANKLKMSAESLSTYKKRVKGLISDYEKYGVDTTKMASWNPAQRVRVHKPTGSTQNKKITNVESMGEVPKLEASDTSSAVARFELPLRPGVKAIILIPSDITTAEVGKIKKYIDYVESISIPD